MKRPSAPQSATISPKHADVVVVGAGVIGLSIAWAVALSGRTVTVVDRSPGSGATRAAAGMLAPVSELQYGEEHLLELLLASAALYPAFIDSLGVHTDAVDYRATRTLVVGADAADRHTLSDLRTAQLAAGLSVDAITVKQARTLEAALSPQLSCAFSIERDHQLDPRQLVEALCAALSARAAHAEWARPWAVHQNALALVRGNGSAGEHGRTDATTTVTGVLLEDGSTLRASTVIVANGLAAAQLGGMPLDLGATLRAVHGDIVRLRVPQQLRPLFSHTIRGLVRGAPVYLVPRGDGTVVVGATQREDELAGASAGGVHQLLRDAQVLVPAVAELELIEVMARARPGTPDNAPLLGRVADEFGDVGGLIIATGFFRHGVLLAPFAARLCVALLEGDHRSEKRWRHFRPDRFARARSQPGSQPGSHSSSTVKEPQQ